MGAVSLQIERLHKRGEGRRLSVSKAVCREEARGGSKSVVALLIPQLSYLAESFAAFTLSEAILAFGVFNLSLLLAITARGGPDSYFSLATVAFGATVLRVPRLPSRPYHPHRNDYRPDFMFWTIN